MIRTSKIIAAAAAAAVTVLIAVILTSCAALSPGADPFVVRVEQSQTAAAATFDMILNVELASPAFWKTNAAPFYQFCEWLKTPVTYCAAASGTCIPCPRCVVMQLNVDDLKVAYKASKTTGTSNALWSAWSVLNTAIAQSSSWSNIVTTATH